MNGNDNLSEISEPPQQTRLPRLSADSPYEVPQTDVVRAERDASEGAIFDNREVQIKNREDVAQLREDAADLREDAADLREDAAHLREGSAATREQFIRKIENLQAAWSNDIELMRQVNERLVVATMEAQRLAAEVQIVTKKMENAKSIAEKANLAKSKFLSQMSHELRTPLNAILGFAQLLERASPPPSDIQAARLHQITKAGWYLLELINQILDLAVIEAGRLNLELEAVPLAKVLSECQAMSWPQAQQYNVQFKFHDVDPDWLVLADFTRLKQVLLNLISNAIKYNRADGMVEVKCSQTAQHIRVSIQDSGDGLSPEKIAQLFQAFNRLGQEGGEKQGTGIGLVVAKQLVELMGGTIGVESTVGAGSEFWVELKRYVTPASA